MTTYLILDVNFKVFIHWDGHMWQCAQGGRLESSFWKSGLYQAGLEDGVQVLRFDRNTFIH